MLAGHEFPPPLRGGQGGAFSHSFFALTMRLPVKPS
jgi:hypothetical protein